MRRRSITSCKWNDRFDSGEPVRSYRFDYQILPSTPAEDRAHPGAPEEPAMNEIVLAPATRQLELLRTGQLSVSELAEAHIQQIERLESRSSTPSQTSMPSASAHRPGNWMHVENPRSVARSAGHHQVFNRDRRLPLRDRQPDSQRRYTRRGCRRRGAPSRCRSADSGHNQLPGVSDGLRDRQPASRPHAQSLGPGSFAQRIERRRIGSHRRRPVCRRAWE